MSEYFIKRVDQTHGPFSSEQLKSGLESGKFKNSDQISEGKDGPWLKVEHFISRGAKMQSPFSINQARPNPEAKEKVFKKAGATFEKAEKTFEKFSLGFLINPKPFLSGSIYDYKNKAFPALAAAIRYYAFVTRIGYFIFLAGAFFWLPCTIGTVILFGLSDLLEGQFLAVLFVPLTIVAVILFFFILLLASNVYLILQLGFCEVARVLLKIESNTRTSA
jgi:hypothetical protein